MMDNISFHALWMRLNAEKFQRNELWENLSEEDHKRQRDDNVIENIEREFDECRNMIAKLEQEKTSMLKTWPIDRVFVEAENVHDEKFREWLLMGLKKERIRDGLLEPTAVLNNMKTFRELQQIHRDMVDIIEFKLNYRENLMLAHGTINVLELPPARFKSQIISMLDNYFPTDELQQRLPEIEALLNEKDNERRLAFMMGTHPRLGGASPQLDNEMFRSFILNNKPY